MHVRVLLIVPCMLTKSRVVIPVMFAHVTTLLLPSRAAAIRCAASCSQTLKTTASRKEQVAVTTSVTCHSRPVSHLLSVHSDATLRSFVRASRDIENSTPTAKRCSKCHVHGCKRMQTVSVSAGLAAYLLSNSPHTRVQTCRARSRRVRCQV